MPLKKVSALVLAAGRSSRMGEVNKMLLNYQGKSFLNRVISQLQDCQLRELIVVTGFEEATVRAQLPTELRVVHNPFFQSGVHSSIQTGLAALANDSDGFLVCMGADLAMTDEINIFALT